MDAAFCLEVVPYLQADLALLKEMKRLNGSFFDKKFADAIKGRYTHRLIQKKVKRKTLTAFFTALAFGPEFKTLSTIGTSIMTALNFKTDYSVKRKKVVRGGQKTDLKYLKPGTMGNLWQSRNFVNGFKVVPKLGKPLTVSDDFDTASHHDLQPGAVLTPGRRSKDNVSLWVSWIDEHRRLKSGWVAKADVIPSAYKAESPLPIKSSPDPDALVRHRLSKGEVFAVSQNVMVGEDTVWMELADGRGFVLQSDTRVVGPLVEEVHWEKPAARKALRRTFKLQNHWLWIAGRMGFSVAMFTAGFWTAGLTWGVATAVDTADSLQSAGLERQAMTDLDVKLNYLLMRLREWEMEAVTIGGKRCHVSDRRMSCPDGTRCIRQWAFFDFDDADRGFGWCMASDRPVQESGEKCLVHADCESGHCERAADCGSQQRDPMKCLGGFCGTLWTPR